MESIINFILIITGSVFLLGLCAIIIGLVFLFIWWIVGFIKTGDSDWMENEYIERKKQKQREEKKCKEENIENKSVQLNHPFGQRYT